MRRGPALSLAAALAAGCAQLRPGWDSAGGSRTSAPLRRRVGVDSIACSDGPAAAAAGAALRDALSSSPALAAAPAGASGSPISVKVRVGPLRRAGGSVEAWARLEAFDPEGRPLATLEESSSARSRDKALGAVFRRLVPRLAEAASAVPWTARVSSARGDLLYLDAGSETGLRAGMELECFHQGPPILDPSTKGVLGREEVAVGRVRLLGASEAGSVARLTAATGAPLSERAVCRPLK